MGICHWKMIHFWLLDRIGAFRSVLTFYRSWYNFEGVKFESHEHTRRQIQQTFYPERCEITCMEKLKWQTLCSPTKLFSFSRVLCDKLVWEKFEVAKEAGGFCLTCLFAYSICVCVFSCDWSDKSLNCSLNASSLYLHVCTLRPIARRRRRR